MSGRESTRIAFDFDALELYDDNCVGLFCLTDRERTIVLSALRIVIWPSRWMDEDGKLLRDVGRDADLTDALERSENLIARFTEC